MFNFMVSGLKKGKLLLAVSIGGISCALALCFSSILYWPFLFLPIGGLVAIWIYIFMTKSTVTYANAAFVGSCAGLMEILTIIIYTYFTPHEGYAYASMILFLPVIFFFSAFGGICGLFLISLKNMMVKKQKRQIFSELRHLITSTLCAGIIIAVASALIYFFFYLFAKPVVRGPVVWRSSGVQYFNPTFTLDGKNILYEGEGEIYLSNLEGTVIRNLTKHPAEDSHPLLSPNGEFIIFNSNRDGQGELYKMTLKGTDLTNLTQNSANDSIIAFSYDGENVIFQREITPSETVKSERSSKKYSTYFNPDASRYCIMSATVNGSNQRTLIRGGSRVRISPDGKWIAYNSINNEIRVIKIDGSGDHKIEEGFPITWTPDSKSIFYSSIRQFPDDPSHIFFINIDGTGKKKCLDNADSSTSWYFVDPRNFWSPSKSLLALAVQNIVGIKNAGIAILDSKGDVVADYRSGRRGDYDNNLSWSPDGKCIVFKKSGGIFIMKADGTEEDLIIADKVTWEKGKP